MSTWIRVSEECLQHSVSLCHEGLKRLLKEGPTWYQQGVPNKVAYMHIHKNEKCVNISHNSWCELVEIML